MPAKNAVVYDRSGVEIAYRQLDLEALGRFEAYCGGLPFPVAMRRPSLDQAIHLCHLATGLAETELRRRLDFRSMATLIEAACRRLKTYSSGSLDDALPL